MTEGASQSPDNPQSMMDESSPVKLYPQSSQVSFIMVDANGEIIQEYSDEDDSDDGENATGDNQDKKQSAQETVKKIKKKNEVYLDIVGVRSRNERSNIIKKDKKNVTVGKLLN